MITVSVPHCPLCSLALWVKTCGAFGDVLVMFPVRKPLFACVYGSGQEGVLRGLHTAGTRAVL